VATVRLECHIGRASSTFELPAAFHSEPTFLQAHFSAGSDQVIDIVPRNHCAEPALVDENRSEVDALDLHMCIDKLASNPAGANRVDRIALVLADVYGPRKGVLGVMFDRGRATVDDPNDAPQFTATPREGCAIFVGAIRKLRPDAAELDREVEFSVIHELGHLFNLDHLAAPHTFMATSEQSRAFPDEYFAFSPGQRLWLSECDSNPSVYPGGSKFEPVSGANEAQAQAAGHSTTAKVELRINIANRSFPCSTPIEMDVELHLCAGVEKTLRVRDRLDPGYSEFKLWITHPNGERRRYRSPRRYCAPDVKLTLKAGRPISRDISIFTGATGSTFATPGLYQLQAQFDLGRRGCVVSNIVTVEAVANHKVLTRERIKLFADPGVRAFLYHRSPKVGARVIEHLEAHLHSQPQGVGANDMRYALVRALARSAEHRSATWHRVLDHVRNAQDDPGMLGSRQHYHLNAIFKQILAI
jgi:hypothetical protein